jgi:hypothetical protein
VIEQREKVTGHSYVTRNERAHSKNYEMGPLHIYFLFEGIIFSRFHALALISLLLFLIFTTA